jgi:hypothetical protein
VDYLPPVLQTKVFDAAQPTPKVYEYKVVWIIFNDEYFFLSLFQKSCEIIFSRHPSQGQLGPMVMPPSHIPKISLAPTPFSIETRVQMKKIFHFHEKRKLRENEHIFIKFLVCANFFVFAKVFTKILVFTKLFVKTFVLRKFFAKIFMKKFVFRGTDLKVFAKSFVFTKMFVIFVTFCNLFSQKAKKFCRDNSQQIFVSTLIETSLLFNL